MRYNAYTAREAGKLHELIPSTTLDMQLKSGEYSTNVACLLGVDVMDKGEVCKFCGMLLDGFGIHCLSCMGGGDHTLQHNAEGCKGVIRLRFA